MAAISLVGISGCKGADSPLGVKIELKEKTFANGLRVIVIEDHTVPVVTYQTWYRVGSVDEKKGMTGISHLFEHLMFKGTPKYGPRKFFEMLESKGAEVNAYTMRDYTVYYETFSPEMLPTVVDLESDRMQNLTLSQEVLDTEKQVVMEERRLKTDNSPVGKMQETLWLLAFRSHPYQWPVVGYLQDVMDLTLPQVLEYYTGHYQPKNATLVLVGDLKAEPTFEMLRKAYGEIPSQKVPKRKIAPEPEQTDERRLVLKDQVSSEKLAQAYHCSAAEDDDSYALDVLANILFEGSSSLAYRRLVEEKDLVVGVSGSAYTPTYPGLFMISATMKGALPATAAEAELDSVIHEVQTTGVTPEEVQRAVRQLTVQLVDSVRTPFGLGQLVGTVVMILNDPERYGEDLAKYLKVTPADVQRVARKYLVPAHRSVITLVPDSSIKVKPTSGAANPETGSLQDSRAIPRPPEPVRTASTRALKLDASLTGRMK